METEGLLTGFVPNSSLQLLIIILASLAVYFNAVFNGFVFDDIRQILGNRWITSAKYVPEIFFTNVWAFEGLSSNYYRPAMHIIYMLTYYAFGLAPWGFHLVNILFHAGVSVLVFLASRRLLEKTHLADAAPFLSPPFIAALLFATHPIHTEVVTPVMGIPDLSFTFFYLLSFLLYIRFRRGDSWSYLFSVVAFFMATLCKEPALTMPIFLLVYDYAYPKERFRLSSFFKRVVPYLVIMGIYFVLRFLALGGILTGQSRSQLTPYQYFINIFPLFSMYLEKLIIPINLNFLHTFQHITSLFEMKSIFSLAITIAFVAVAFIALKKWKSLSIGLLFIILPLLPSLYIPALNQDLENVFAERYLYLSSFGFVLLLGSLMKWTTMKNTKRGTALGLFFFLVIGFYSIGVINRNPIWKDDYTLFEDAVKKSPNSTAALEGLGYALLKNGRIDEAIKEYQIAIALKPDNANAHFNLGFAYASKGWIDGAIEQYRAGLTLRPDQFMAHNNLGAAYDSKGLFDEAIEEYRLAIGLKPDWAPGYNNLGVSYAKKGLMDEAIKNLRIAITLDPNNQEFRDNLAKAYDEKSSR